MPPPNRSKKGRGGYDPTKTTGIRNAAVRDVNRRLAALRKLLMEVVGKEDRFSLNPVNLANPIGLANGITINARYVFATDEQKLKAFSEWFMQEVRRGMLSVGPDGADPQQPWMSDYVNSAYRQGINNAYLLTRSAAKSKSAEFAAGQQAEFIRSAFGGPEAMSKVRFLATRTYNDLKGVSDYMAQQMSRVMADSIANGLGALQTARNLVDKVDGMSAARARMVARTELIAAHAEGQLDSFQKLGVEELGVKAEFATAGDSRVCPLCAALEGNVYTVAEARGVIPVHPACRCSFLPYISESAHKQIRTSAP